MNNGLDTSIDSIGLHRAEEGGKGLVRLRLVAIVSDIRVEEGLVQRLPCQFVLLKSLGVN